MSAEWSFWLPLVRCRYCGESFVPSHNSKGGPMRHVYCSIRCKDAYHNSNRRKKEAAARVE